MKLTLYYISFLQDIRKHLKDARPEVETLVVQDPFQQFNPTDPNSDLNPNSDPNTDRDTDTDRSPSGEVDEADPVTMESLGQNQVGQGQTESAGPVEWTTIPSQLEGELDLEDDLEDEGLQLLEETKLSGVNQEESLTDEDEMDEQLIRGEI